MPDATAAADPPEEPAGLKEMSQGFRVTPEESIIRSCASSEFRRVGLAKNNSSRLLQARHDLRVFRWNVVLK